MAGTDSKRTAATADVPAYADLFPELNSMVVGQNKVPSIVGSTHVGAVKSSQTTTVFRIGAEEQRHADDAKMRRGIDEIATKTKVAIDTSYTKDGTLCVVLTGRGKAVNEAKALLLRKLQKEAEIEMVGIPPEHYRAILGRGGETIKGIQQETQTRIHIPASDDMSGVIRITGSIDGCGKARTMIQCISDVEANRDRVKLEVLKTYHPLVVGHKGERIKAIAKETGAAIHVPPSSKPGDEITITGEKKAVAQAVEQISAIYKDLQVSCGELSANIKKAQHRFVIGPRGAYLDEVMREFGVVVEIPPADVESDTVTLRGPQLQLVHALTRVFERANSMTADELHVPGWLHRLLIGKKGATLTELTKPFPNSSLDFCEDEELVKLEGPPVEVAGLKQLLAAKRDEMIATLADAELRVKPDLHARIIGKNGSTIGKIKEATGVQVTFPRPDAEDNNDLIRLHGPKAGVQAAVVQINDIVKKLQDQTELKYKVEQQLHSLIIGTKGSQIKKMMAECGEVNLNVPKGKDAKDEITITGSKASVTKAKAYLDELVVQLREANHVMEVTVYKPYHGTVIGKAGVTVNKIKEETGVRIDIPGPGNASDLITLTGPKAKCEEARKRILKIQDGIAKIIDDKVRFSDALQFKAQDVIIPAVRHACGGILVTPMKDELGLRGPAEDVAAARARLADVVKKYHDGQTIETVEVPKKHCRQLARQTADITAMETESGALIFIPPPGGKDTTAAVTCVGTADACKAAASLLATRIEELEDVTKETVEVARKYQKEMLSKKSKFLTDLKAATGISIHLPKKDDAHPEAVKLEGSKRRMPDAVQMIKDFVADIDARVTVKVHIPARDHRVFFVNQGAEIKRITEAHNVSIKIPDRRKDTKEGGGGGGNNRGGGGGGRKGPAAAAKASSPDDGADAAATDDQTLASTNDPDTDTKPSADANVDKPSPATATKAGGAAASAASNARDNIITITGTPANCAAAEAALREMLPVEDTLDVDPDLHRFIIGKGGEAVRKFKMSHNVQLTFPKSSTDATIRVRGDKAKVAAAIEALKARVVELSAVKADLQAKSFKVELSIDPRFHVRLIGKQGANVNKLREEFGVDIQFPDRRKKLSATDAKRITITGYEDAANKAAASINATVEELASMVTISLDVHPGCHRKIIGRGGASIKALQSKHKVRVVMPREDNDPVRIEGAEKAALDCKDAILEIEEEWKQEAEDYEEDSMYVRPSRYDEPKEKPKKQTFKVKDAPWEKPPDSQDSASFPGLGGGAAAPAAANGGVWSRPAGQ
eukprot:m.35258 g.35258  ORF g.35258 m.35258 type:complete len:1290 (+) comp5260_c0_seq1:88-3957(+)